MGCFSFLSTRKSQKKEKKKKDAKDEIDNFFCENRRLDKLLTYIYIYIYYLFPNSTFPSTLFFLFLSHSLLLFLFFLCLIKGKK